MIDRRLFAGMLLGGIVTMAGCTDFNPYKYRFKLSVEIETPAGLRRGSSVHEVWANTNFPGSGRQYWGEKGEAVVVDLPNGQALFALMKTGAIHGDMASLSMATLDPEFKNAMVESGKKLSKQETSESVLVERKNYPMLVTFKDIKAPTSVELVDPEDLGSSFGSGYRLKAVTVKLTDEPVTGGITKKLKWLEAVGRERATFIPIKKCDPDPMTSAKLCYPNGLSEIEKVKSSYFSTELYK
jgi:hypothetical protein